LDFLLSKASEYSNFIANDLEELQATMTDKASKDAARAEKKKRKAQGKAEGSSKKNKGESMMESAKAKDEAARSGCERTKVIFTQPANLSRDCTLKDYQLEGVRWLASLYENGVSGILADGRHFAL
jgi:ATP-dependent DNA helicase